jgi:hypothetical protein
MGEKVLTAGELLDGHAALNVQCLDRVYLNTYVPILQTSSQVVAFLSGHLGFLTGVRPMATWWIRGRPPFYSSPAICGKALHPGDGLRVAVDPWCSGDQPVHHRACRAGDLCCHVGSHMPGPLLVLRRRAGPLVHDLAVVPEWPPDPRRPLGHPLGLGGVFALRHRDAPLINRLVLIGNYRHPSIRGVLAICWPVRRDRRPGRACFERSAPI